MGHLVHNDRYQLNLSAFTKVFFNQWTCFLNFTSDHEMFDLLSHFDLKHIVFTENWRSLSWYLELTILLRDIRNFFVRKDSLVCIWVPLTHEVLFNHCMKVTLFTYFVLFYINLIQCTFCFLTLIVICLKIVDFVVYFKIILVLDVVIQVELEPFQT